MSSEVLELFRPEIDAIKQEADRKMRDMDREIQGLGREVQGLGREVQEANQRIKEMVVNFHALNIPITQIAKASKLTEEEVLSMIEADAAD